MVIPLAAQRLLSASLLAMVVSTATTEVLADSPASAPQPSTHASTMPRAIAGGAVLFAVAYGLALYVPLRDDFSGESDWLAVPVAGPTIAMARGIENVNYWGLAIDQIGQLGGLTLIVAGSIHWASESSSVAIRAAPNGRGVSVQVLY